MIWACREGQIRRNSNFSSLSGRRLPISDHMYSRSHGFPSHVISARLVSLPFCKSCYLNLLFLLGILLMQFSSCFVRARRLNVIIQPHLRFAYELLKWDEVQQQRRGEPTRRELEWATIAREIAAMNKPYAR